MRSLLLSALIAGSGASFAAAAADLFDSREARSAREQAERALDTLETTWIPRGGLEIVTGGPSSARTQSRWGHISLRFVGSAERPLEDLTIEAMALTGPDASIPEVIVKGAFGGFAIAPVVQSLGELIRAYYFQEMRGYTRTIIPSTAARRRALIDTLRAVTKERTGHDRYYFLTTNCTSYVSWILNQAGFAQLPAPVPFLPTLASLHLRRSFVSPWPEIEGVSAKRLHAYAEGIDDLATTNTLDLQRLIVFRGVALGPAFFRANAELERRTDIHAADDVYGVKSLGPEFYQSDPTRAPNADEVRSAFKPRQLTEARRANRAALRTNYTTSFCRGAVEQCAYFTRVQSVLKTLAP